MEKDKLMGISLGFTRAAGAPLLSVN